MGRGRQWAWEGRIEALEHDPLPPKREGLGRGPQAHAPPPPVRICLFRSPSSNKKKIRLLGAFRPFFQTCIPTHCQPGQMLSKTEFCLNAQKGDLGDQNLKQINMCGRRLLITAVITSPPRPLRKISSGLRCAGEGEAWPCYGLFIRT